MDTYEDEHEEPMVGNQAAPRASYMFSMLTDTEHFAKESCYQPLMSFLGFSSFL